ncbi:MAG: PEP/pyruvate-binding domain-containing protein, partial [Clostridia bacterium]
MRQDQLTDPAGARPAMEWLYDGAAGGKGEGLIALAGLTSSQAGPGSESQQTPGLASTIPRTGIVGTRAWEEFITTNTLDSCAAEMYAGEAGGYPALRAAYLDAALPEALTAALERFMPPRGRPLMVRSSSVLEDHTDTPFAGIYESYALPNSHPDDETRLQQLCDAVKLVYASLYSPGAMAYRSAVSSDGSGTPATGGPAGLATGESMAVIIQELVGRKRGRWFYPLVSGTAQSLNYYA